MTHAYPRRTVNNAQSTTRILCLCVVCEQARGYYCDNLGNVTFGIFRKFEDADKDDRPGKYKYMLANHTLEYPKKNETRKIHYKTIYPESRSGKCKIGDGVRVAMQALMIVFGRLFSLSSRVKDHLDLERCKHGFPNLSWFA